MVASPRARAGKTLLARLLMETGASPCWPTTFPALVCRQMELFDRLVAARTKIIDVAYRSFEQFFGVMGDIGFAQERQRLGMDTVVFYP